MGKSSIRKYTLSASLLSADKDTGLVSYHDWLGVLAPQVRHFCLGPPRVFCLNAVGYRASRRRRSEASGFACGAGQYPLHGYKLDALIRTSAAVLTVRARPSPSRRFCSDVLAERNMRGEINRASKHIRMQDWRVFMYFSQCAITHECAHTG
jgi:hypothetical protein